MSKLTSPWRFDLKTEPVIIAITTIDLHRVLSPAGRARKTAPPIMEPDQTVPENAKRPDDPRSLTLSNENTPENEAAGDASPLRDVEAQMRRALGLAGAPRRGDVEHPVVTKPPHPANRFGPGGHKRCFAQDGEVPVTMLNGRRDHPADAPVNRLGIAETAAAAERAAREKAERDAAVIAALTSLAIESDEIAGRMEAAQQKSLLICQG